MVLEGLTLTYYKDQTVTHRFQCANVVLELISLGSHRGMRILSRLAALENETERDYNSRGYSEAKRGYNAVTKRTTCIERYLEL